MIPVLLKRGASEFKTDESKLVVYDEGLDQRDAQARLLHMKQQITALAGGKEVRKPGEAGQRGFEQFLPTAPYFVGRRSKPVFGNEFTCLPNIAAAGFTVKPNVHQATWPQ